MKMMITGRIIFAIGLMALGVWCLIYGDFIIGRPPAWPPDFDLAAFTGYVGGSVCILSGLAILLDKKNAMAALTIVVCIVLFSLSRYLLFYKNDWLNGLKTLALLGGALIAVCAAIRDPSQQIPQFLMDPKIFRSFLFAGMLFLSAFFIGGGYAHFKFAGFVVDFIPAYIPFREFFTYFCGICLIAGGIGMFIPFFRKWAALLSAIMIAGWFLLLHIPRFISDVSNTSDRLGLCESFAFAGVCFMLAGLFQMSRK